jgi:hypothetical protein
LRSDDWRRLAVELATTIPSSNWFGIAARTVWNYPWVLIGALVALWIMLRVDWHLDARYSEFWHELRGPLRELLEKTRA